MMKTSATLTALLAASSLLVSAQTGSFYNVNDGLKLESVSKIGLGSCARQDKPMPVLQLVAKAKPDVFVWLGDNIYGDTEDMALLREKYRLLGEHAEFQELNRSSYFMAVWDDHDFGVNDGGKEYPKKAETKAVFLDFWNEPSRSARFNHSGIYHSTVVGKPGQEIQFIMLDGRTFRDTLLHKAKGDSTHFRNDYKPNYSPSATLLGAEQWAWLEQQLLIPAQVRVICSGTQFGISYNGYEAWANFPVERQRMLEMIKKTRAEGILFISGDVHYGELSRVEQSGLYPIYDLTSSGITQTWPHVEKNTNRIGKASRKNNFGLIEIDWLAPDPHITLSLTSVKAKRVLEYKLRLSELKF